MSKNGLSGIVQSLENRTDSTFVNETVNKVIDSESVSSEDLQDSLQYTFGREEAIVFIICTLVSQCFILIEWPRCVSRLIRSNSPLKLPLDGAKKIRDDEQNSDLADEAPKDTTSRKVHAVLFKIIFVVVALAVMAGTIFFSIYVQTQQQEAFLVYQMPNILSYHYGLITAFIQIAFSWLVLHPIYIIWEAKYAFGKIKMILRT
jgi:hypothetical protein